MSIDFNFLYVTFLTLSIGLRILRWYITDARSEKNWPKTGELWIRWLVLRVMTRSKMCLWMWVGLFICCWRPSESIRSRNFVASGSSETSTWMLKSPTNDDHVLLWKNNWFHVTREIPKKYAHWYLVVRWVGLSIYDDNSEIKDSTRGDHPLRVF